MSNLFRCLPVCHSGHLCAQVPFQYLAAKLAQVRITTCINCEVASKFQPFKYPRKLPELPLEPSQNFSDLSEPNKEFKFFETFQRLEPSKSLQNTAMRLRCKAQIATVKPSKLRKPSDPSEAKRPLFQKTTELSSASGTLHNPLEPSQDLWNLASEAIKS